MTARTHRHNAGDRTVRRRWVVVGAAGGSVAWGGGEPPVGAAGQLPTPLMDRPVVSPAHQGQVGQVGGAAIGPVDQMMTLAPGKRAGAVGDHTAAVADGQGAALGGADDPAGPPHVQGLAGGAAQGRGESVHGCLELVGQALLATAVVGVGAAGVVVVTQMVAGVAGDHHSGQGPVTSQPPTCLRAQRPGPAGLTTQAARAAEQAVQVHRDGQLGADAAGLGQLAALQGPPGELGQGIGAALVAAALIAGIGRAGQGLQGRQHDLAGFGFEQSLERDHALEGWGPPTTTAGHGGAWLGGRPRRGR
jgi:hypothetical protein